jgi:tRNA threonylcarbamoyladenosine biosynthesis protein TsaE
MQRIFTHSAKETEAAGKKFAQSLSAGDVVAFFGGLGMGKTAFIRGMAQGLDIKDPVSSPTFALVHEYRGKIPLYHFDMYRVSTWEDLYSTGFFDYLEAGGICAVEWSENIEEALPENTIRIEISKADSDTDNDDDTRIITIKGKCINENSCD